MSSNSKWLWEQVQKAPERLTDQERMELDLLARAPGAQAYKRYLEGLLWATLSQMVSNPASEQDRWRFQGEYDVLMRVIKNWEK